MSDPCIAIESISLQFQVLHVAMRYIKSAVKRLLPFEKGAIEKPIALMCPHNTSKNAFEIAEAVVRTV